jgi:hypothetical protein
MIVGFSDDIIICSSNIEVPLNIRNSAGMQKWSKLELHVHAVAL